MNRTAIIKKIDGHDIVTGFGELSVDPMATNPFVVIEIQNTDEFKAVKAVQDKRNASVKMAGGAFKLSKAAKNKGDKGKHWRDSLNHLEQAKGHENEIAGLLPALKAKRKELIVTKAVYFEPKNGEHVIDADTVADMSAKIQDGNLVNLKGDIMADNRGVAYCKKTGSKWTITGINTLGVAVPNGVTLYGDLDETQKSEVDLQIEINRVAIMTEAERAGAGGNAEKAALNEAAAMRSRLEIQGTSDPLAESQAWYKSRLAELELIYG